jgi:hypothetical protein
LWGPGGIYGELGGKLKDTNITALQLDYISLIGEKRGKKINERRGKDILKL